MTLQVLDAYGGQQQDAGISPIQQQCGSRGPGCEECPDHERYACSRIFGNWFGDFGKPITPIFRPASA
jgi:hypothetical protein